MESDFKKNVGYDATEYSSAREQNWTKSIEEYTVDRILEVLDVDFVDKKVADLACGTFVYGRKLLDRGAISAIALDGDQKMIEQAIKETQSYSKPVQFINSLIQNVKGDKDCGIAIGAWLMNYARTPEEAIRMCKSLASFLTEDGLYLGIMNNPFQRKGGQQYKKYGFSKKHFSDLEGDCIGSKVEWNIDNLSETIVNYNLSPEHYESAFKKAGMDFKWQELYLDPIEEKTKWKTFFKDPAPAIMIIAKKKRADYDFSKLK